MRTQHRAATEIAAGWAKTLLGLREPSVQVGWVKSQLLDLGAARSADVLSIVLSRAQQREEMFSVLLLRVSLSLSGSDTEPLKRAIANIALLRGQTNLARFLGALSQVSSPDAQDSLRWPSDDPDAAPNAKKQPDFGTGRPLSLGERKSIARKRDRNLLAQVLRDPHPDVIRVVLDNPALVEEDVVRLCAQRPISGAVLLQVFQHPRWVLRPRIRLTLALNPHTPESVTLQMLPHLSPADLREVARAAQLSEQIRAACIDRGEHDLGERTLH